MHEIFLQVCADVGICINWRSKQICPITCFPHNSKLGILSKLITKSRSFSPAKFYEESKVLKYEACGNPCPPTCDYRNLTSCPWKRLEGCYYSCKDGTLLFIAYKFLSCVQQLNKH